MEDYIEPYWNPNGVLHSTKSKGDVDSAINRKQIMYQVGLHGYHHPW